MTCTLMLAVERIPLTEQWALYFLKSKHHQDKKQMLEIYYV